MNNKAFTLIELIVWISISMILMISVGIFVNNWMLNIINQKKIIENTNNLTEFISKIHTSINLMSSWTFQPQKTASWIIFKRAQNLWEWGFSYIWEMNSTDNSDWDWIYCLSWSEDTNTRHLVLKNFIPFEEENEDIFTDYDLILKSKLTGQFQSFQKEHVIKKSWNIIIWKWIFWNKFEEWASWKDIYLNSPTWLAKKWNILFISDTLNNRILYYKISDDKIYTLLDESDWLNEPTWLYYNDTEKALYIANSWNWEILKYSSKSDSQWTITLTGITQNNINKIEISFFNKDWILQNINNPNKNDITFTSLSKWDDYLEKNNKLIYYFITYWISQFQTECNVTGEILSSSWNPINCTDTNWTTWTWQSSTLNNKNFSNWDIKIININNLTNNWNYYINLKLFNNSTEKYSEYFPYFTKSDNNILTPDDNKLEIIESWLNYPTWLWWNWTIQHNDFWNHTFNTSIFQEHSSDIILKTPINYLNTTINNWLVTLFLKYYKKYNCYNLDDKTERTYLFNKNLK